MVAVTGELLAIAGVVLIGFLAYQFWGRTGQIVDAQVQLNNRLEQSWQAPPAPSRKEPGQAVPASPPEGAPLVRLSIPRLDLQWTVVEGTDLKDLKGTLGHYTGTQLPGEPGNFAVAGHRFHGLFYDLDKVKPGDEVVVEDRNSRYVYRVDDSSIVSPGDMAVLAPVPGQPGGAPTTAEITLTTCNPKWDHYQRLIVTGKLESKTPKNTPSGGVG